MRFITEFELHSGYNLEIKDYKSFRECASAQALGLDIAKVFGWQSRGEGTMRAVGLQIMSTELKKRHTLEIEAFPMDKWVEFRKKLIAELPEYDSAAKIRIMNALSDLEHYEQSK